MMQNVSGAILCAGFGTRLAPVTHDIPKPAVPFLSRPLASYALYAMKLAGIKNIAANVHYLPDKMRQSLENHCSEDVRLSFFHEKDEILGTGGGLRELAKCLPPENTIVLYHGDVLCGLPLAEAIASHRASGADVTLVLATRHPNLTLRGVFCDATGNIVQIRNDRAPHFVEPLTEFAFTGIHIIEPKILKELPETGASCLVTEIYPKLLRENRRIHAHITTAFFADVGTHERFTDAQARVLEHPEILPAPTDLSLHDIHIETGATIQQPVCLNGKIHIAAGASIGPNVCLCGSISCGANAQLQNVSVFGSGVIDENMKDRVVFLKDDRPSD